MGPLCSASYERLRPALKATYGVPGTWQAQAIGLTNADPGKLPFWGQLLEEQCVSSLWLLPAQSLPAQLEG